MAKIALISDVHLGTKQYGLKERYEDFLTSFTRFGDDVACRSVDAVVIGGDLFDSPRPDALSVYHAKNVIGGIKRPVYGIDGNHDLSGGDWLRVIGAEVLPDFEVVEIAGVKVAGLSYRSGRDLIAAIQQLVDAGVKADVLVAHFALAEMNGGGSADTGVQELTPLLEKLGVKAVLMGHVHIPDCRKWNGILFVNPGSTEMKSSNEPQEKFYFILDTDTWEAHEVPLVTRTVQTVEITNEDELLAFREKLMEEARVAISDGLTTERPFYQVIADDSIDDVFKRLSSASRDASALVRIVLRSSAARDLAPVVDRKEGVATLESAIEARFPKESPEARLTANFLHAPEPSAIHLVVERFMADEK